MGVSFLSWDVGLSDVPFIYLIGALHEIMNTTIDMVQISLSSPGAISPQFQLFLCIVQHFLPSSLKFQGLQKRIYVYLLSGKNR
jgi:hypothetical protein